MTEAIEAVKILGVLVGGSAAVTAFAFIVAAIVTSLLGALIEGKER